MSEEGVVTTLCVAGVSGTHGPSRGGGDQELLRDLLHTLEFSRYL